MMRSVHRAVGVCFGSLLLISHCVTSFLVIPDEYPTFLQLVYSKIPPLRKGTDSRLGVGFRLGEHADFQILFELGPQQRTDPIGNNVDSKKKRAVMFGTAIKKKSETKKREKLLEIKSQLPGLRPKVNLESKQEKNVEEKAETKNEGSEWLLKWRHGIVEKPSDSANLNTPTEKTKKINLGHVTRLKVVNPKSNANTKRSHDDSSIFKMLFGIS